MAVLCSFVVKLMKNFKMHVTNLKEVPEYGVVRPKVLGGIREPKMNRIRM